MLPPAPPAESAALAPVRVLQLHVRGRVVSVGAPWWAWPLVSVQLSVEAVVQSCCLLRRRVALQVGRVCWRQPL